MKKEPKKNTLNFSVQPLRNDELVAINGGTTPPPPEPPPSDPFIGGQHITGRPRR